MTDLEKEALEYVESTGFDRDGIYKSCEYSYIGLLLRMHVVYNYNRADEYRHDSCFIKAYRYLYEWLEKEGLAECNKIVYTVRGEVIVITLSGNSNTTIQYSNYPNVVLSRSF